MQIEQLPLGDSDTVSGPRPEDALSAQLRFWRRSIAKKRWVIVALTLLVGAIATLIVYSMTPHYRSTATLYIEPAKEKVLSIDPCMADSAETASISRPNWRYSNRGNWRKNSSNASS